MTTRDALIAACRANRADNLPRLVFADWLDETGSELDATRASRIREMVADGEVKTRLEFDSVWWTWDRGFVVGVECAADWWLRHGDDLIREHDVQTVRLTTWPAIESVSSPANRLQHVSLRDAHDRVSVIFVSDFELARNPDPRRAATLDLLRAHWPSIAEWSLPSGVSLLRDGEPIGYFTNFRRDEQGRTIADARLFGSADDVVR